MSIDINKYITDEQKKKIILDRLAQFAAEAYQHSMNAEVSKSLGNEAGVENAEQALQILGAAISAHEAELKSLDK